MNNGNNKFLTLAYFQFSKYQKKNNHSTINNISKLYCVNNKRYDKI